MHSLLASAPAPPRRAGLFWLAPDRAWPRFVRPAPRRPRLCASVRLGLTSTPVVELLWTPPPPSGYSTPSQRRPALSGRHALNSNQQNFLHLEGTWFRLPWAMCRRGRDREVGEWGRWWRIGWKRKRGDRGQKSGGMMSLTVGLAACKALVGAPARPLWTGGA
jgi:hypothetical protein